MSIKNLFGKKSDKILPQTTVSEMGEETESVDYVRALIEDKKKFVPKIDYTDFSKFARYGSAEQYYVDAIENIYKTYPYDGSLYEKLNWSLSASDFQNYVFENEYPRNNGYINIGYLYGTTGSQADNYSEPNSKEYIYFKGGPNKSQIEGSIKEQFDTANKIDKFKNRGFNLQINGDSGLTTEFWLKKNNSSGSNKQVIFDLWNSASYATSGYGRFKIEIRPGVSGQENKFFIEMMSGTYGVLSASLGISLNLTSSEWQQFSVSAINNSNQLKLSLYKNGVLNDSILTGSSIGMVSGPYLATIGSLITSSQGLYGNLGWGKLSGSLDEFRFWKTARTDKKINRYWFMQVGGGTNTDDANTDLGVYYKFNEGIYDTGSISSYDTKIIDYSGRISNGVWYGYTLGSRNTGSAMVESTATKTEFKDPVLYSSHPDVISLLAEKTQAAKEYDITNNGNIINSFPLWMKEESEEGLKQLTQIIAEYFDDLHVKIENLPRLKDLAFSEGKPLPFSGRLLESMGFTTTDLFTDSEIIESLLSRTDEKEFEEKLHNIKNLIYQNIYNNLNYIYRSKGTEKSIRNFVRCFGVDEELIKLNAYADGVDYTFEDRYSYGTLRKKYVDFNNPDRFTSTVYQWKDPTNPNSKSYISGNINKKYTGTTLQTEVMFPKKFEQDNPIYFETEFTTSSLFGMHEANSSDESDLTWIYGDRAQFQVYAIRDSKESKNAYFKLTSSYLEFELTSSLFKDVYDNKKWNFAVKTYNEKYPLADGVSGSDNGNTIIEFVGYNTILDTVTEQFYLTKLITSSLADPFFTSNKRLYLGAHRQNFTGSLLQNSDVKISSARYWLTNLPNEIIQEHSKDSSNFGSEDPYMNIDNFAAKSLTGKSIPNLKSLVLNWDFETVTGSDNGSGTGPSNTSDGKFNVTDITSGSISSLSASNLQQDRWGWMGNIIETQHTARGDSFLRNNNQVIDIEYLPNAKKRLPETLNNSDMVNILSQDDEIFTRDTQPVNYYFALEKSMYQTISEEIIKYFGTISAFNNLIGEPINRYKQKYDALEHLRKLFFEKIGNTPNLEKFVDYYKWIDNALTMMVEQLIPASANFSPELKTVIESHVLERNKYWNKYPTLELKAEPPIAGTRGVGELKYNWRIGHAPTPFNEDLSCLWWAKRTEQKTNIITYNYNTLDIYEKQTGNIISAISSLYDPSTSKYYLAYGQYTSNGMFTLLSSSDNINWDLIEFYTGALGSGLGNSVKLVSSSHGLYCFVGAFSSSATGQSGSINYVTSTNGSDWSSFTVQIESGSGNSNFGNSFDVVYDTNLNKFILIVGANRDDNGSSSSAANSGSVYFITSSNGVNWSKKYRIMSGNSLIDNSEDYVGSSVSLLSTSVGYHVYAAAPREDEPTTTIGNIYVVTSSNFDLSNYGWTQQKIIVKGEQSSSQIGIAGISSVEFNNQIYLFFAEPYYDYGGLSDAGALFVVSSAVGNIWDQQYATKTMLASGNYTTDYLGSSNINTIINTFKYVDAKVVQNKIYYAFGSPYADTATNNNAGKLYIGDSSDGIIWKKHTATQQDMTVLTNPNSNAVFGAGVNILVDDNMNIYTSNAVNLCNVSQQVLQVSRKNIFDSINQEFNRNLTRIYNLNMDFVTITDKKPVRSDAIISKVKFGSGEYLTIDASDIPEDKNCKD